MRNKGDTIRPNISLYPEELARLDALVKRLHPNLAGRPHRTGYSETVRSMIGIVEQVLNEQEQNHDAE